VYLARFRRDVLLLDAGHSRAARIPRSHNYPGYPDGVGGGDILASLRAQAAHYPVDTVNLAVDTLAREADGTFHATWEGGSARARLVLLATGARDVEPDMPHLAEALRDGALRYCPVCDGFEVIDQQVGVLGDGPVGLREALYLRHFTPHITLFTLGRAGWSPDAGEQAAIADAGITWVADPVVGMRLWNEKVTVRHGEAETACDAVYAALGMVVASPLATALGAEVDAQGYLVVDRKQRTTVEGLYAAGDVAQGLNQISVACGEAAVAAASMHLLL
jgi:thioredoxin reductase (NADPH)